MKRTTAGTLWPLAIFGLFCGGTRTIAAQETASPVVVAHVIEREVRTARRGVGTVMPLRTSTVGSAVDGRVEEYLVEHGDPVKVGQPLARLRTDTLEIELAAARAELTLSEQQLAELKNGSLPEDIAQARAEMLGAKAVMNNTAARLRRLESLRATNAVSEDELGDARERSEAARQAFIAAEAALKRIEDGPRPEQIAQAQARLQLQKESVRLIEDRIVKHTVLAPFDGFVAAEYSEVGAWISQGDPIADVIQLSEVEVHTPVPAEEALKLRPGSTIRVEFPELPGDLFTGIVHRIVPAADPRSRTFPVYIRLPNRVEEGVPRLMAGMLARAELPVGDKRRLPLVPKDSIVLNGRRKEVLTITQSAAKSGSGVVHSVPVELGVAEGDLIQVEGAIDSGDLVVVFGNERLSDGEQVEVVRIMDRPAASATATLSPSPVNTSGP